MWKTVCACSSGAGELELRSFDLVALLTVFIDGQSYPKGNVWHRASNGQPPVKLCALVKTGWETGYCRPENLMMSSAIESNLGSAYQRGHEPGRKMPQLELDASCIVLFHVIF